MADAIDYFIRSQNENIDRGDQDVPCDKGPGRSEIRPTFSKK